MTTQSMKAVTPAKHRQPVKQSIAQSVRVKKRRNKRVATPSANGQPVKTLKATATPSRPLASFAGMWAADETFDEFVTAMAVNRKVLDADVSQP